MLYYVVMKFILLWIKRILDLRNNLVLFQEQLLKLNPSFANITYSKIECFFSYRTNLKQWPLEFQNIRQKCELRELKRTQNSSRSLEDSSP